MAGGESSYARLRTGQELVIDEAQGATIRDLDGNTYLDYCMGYGVNLFGHAPAFVWEAVEETVARVGWHIAFPHRLAGEAAELVAELVPGIEQLRFANSGTEATQAAVRLARAATGRELVIKFEGHYHGWADHLAAGIGPRRPPALRVPTRPGIPAGMMESLWVVPWNDEAALARGDRRGRGQARRGDLRGRARFGRRARAAPRLPRGARLGDAGGRRARRSSTR